MRRMSESTRGFLPPQQRRSRDALARLLRATLETLDERGLDGATIPRIARAAGMAPASVYRRFRDRDALFRAAMTLALETGAAASGDTLRLDAFKDRTLEGVVAGLVAMTLQQYRSHPGLMRALTRFIEQDSDKTFRSNALAIVADNYRRMVDLLLTFRDEITHPQPRRAITFALLTMATIIEVRALEPVSMWDELLPMSDRELKKDVATIVLAHLRCSAGTAGERSRRKH
jgi:AcrR family transcriptional regulator